MVNLLTLVHNICTLFLARSLQLHADVVVIVKDIFCIHLLEDWTDIGRNLGKGLGLRKE